MRRAVSVSESKPASRASTRKRTTRGARFQAGERAGALDTQERLAVIARAAYLRARRNGFELHRERDAWLAAELEIAGVFVERVFEDDLH